MTIKTSYNAIGNSYNMENKNGYVFQVNNRVHSCCGLGSFSGFIAGDMILAEVGPEEFLQTIYKQCQGAVYGNFLYTLTTGQLQYPSPLHKLFLSLGAVQMGEEFINEYHGPNMLHLFRVNLKKGVGIYYNNRGDPLSKLPVKEVAPKAEQLRDAHGMFIGKDRVAVAYERNLVR